MFQYQNFSAPQAGSIAELMLRRGDIAATQAQQVAAAQAHAAEAQGHIWGSAITQLGQIPQQIQQQQEAALRQQAMRQQVQGGAIDLKEKQKKLEDDETMARIYQGAYGQAPSQQPGFQGPTQPGAPAAGSMSPDGLPPGMVKTADGIVTIKPDYLTEAMARSGMGDKIPGVMANLTKMNESMAALTKTRGEIAIQTRDALGSLGATVEAAGNTSQAFHTAALLAVHNGVIGPDQLKPYLDAVDANPDAVAAITRQLQSGSPKQTELNTAALTARSRQQQADTGSTRLDLERPKIAAETTKVQQETTGTQPMSPYQQAELGNRAAALKMEQGKFGLEQAKFAQTQSDKTDLTPEGLDAAAQMFAKTGQLPALGMGDKTTRKAIINRAAQMTPGLDIASAKADFGANSESLKNVTKTLDTLTAFEATAGKNLDQFLALADKIPDTGVPWANTPIRLVNDKMVGSANQAAANAARDVALREIARVTNDPKLSGVLSDAARQEVSGLSPKDATFAQIKAVAKVLKQDMANVHSSLSDQRDAIGARIKLASPGATPSTPTSVVPTMRYNPATQKVEPMKAGGD